jgi:predicted nucleotidyltransferase
VNYANLRKEAGKTRTGHPSDTKENLEIAENGLILKMRTGSAVSGTSISETSDEDLVGACIEPPSCLIGLDNFDQWEHHTAWLRPGGIKNASGPGDIDITVYSLRKFCGLLLNGNPSLISTLYTPPEHILYDSVYASELRALAPSFVSKRGGERFLGYLKAQREAMLSHNGKGRDVTRKDLVEKYGFDTKFGSHMVRLGYQGLEYMETGTLTLPMGYAWREQIKAVRRGKWKLEEVLLFVSDLEDNLKKAIDTSDWPKRPDYDKVSKWLVWAYQSNWAERDIN